MTERPNDVLGPQEGQGVKWQWPSIHPEGRKFAILAGLITAALWWVIDWDVLGWLMAGVTLWVLAFFRDPFRTTPRDERFVIAPADGMVTLIQSVPPPIEVK